MAKSPPKSPLASRNQPASGRTGTAGQTPPIQGHDPEVVNPLWLIRAIGITIAVALVCGYLSLCLLFYQGQWQLVLHPSRSTPAPPDIAGARFEIVRFGVDQTATPQLTGWFIPAETSARYNAYTVLYLPAGDGSLADAVPDLAALHELGINVFAFDYRGYGQSGPERPNQRRMTEDAGSAWTYLTVSRALQPSHVVILGEGVGAALAAQLAAGHAEAPALILESPRPALILDVLADTRVRSLPVRALFHEDFEITSKVSNLKTPKLFVLNSEDKSPPEGALVLRDLTSGAASPKMVATIKRQDFYGPIYREQMARFFDLYLR